MLAGLIHLHHCFRSTRTHEPGNGQKRTEIVGIDTAMGMEDRSSLRDRNRPRGVWVVSAMADRAAEPRALKLHSGTAVTAVGVARAVKRQDVSGQWSPVARYCQIYQ
jgi:hypothetical protein